MLEPCGLALTPSLPKSSPTCRQSSGRNHACCPTIPGSTDSSGPRQGMGARDRGRDRRCARRLQPPDFMPVDLAAELARPTVIHVSDLLWAARILAALVRVNR